MPTASPPPSSALSDLIASRPPHHSHSPHYHTLALQILHNLQHQHYWTSLYIHTHSPLSNELLPRPLISGLPPHRIYVHPDDQVEELKSGAEDGDAEVEREWVLPTHLAEKWSLKRFAEVFDAVGEEPLTEDDESGDGEEGMRGEGQDQLRRKRRRGGKRVLLATLGDDSSVVYYIVHDGIVKPRQN